MENMKKRLLVAGLALTLILLLGCSIQEDIDNVLFKENLVTKNISFIEIKKDIYRQVITSKDDLDTLTSLTNEIHIKDSNLEANLDLKEHHMIQVKIYDKSRDVIRVFSIGKGILYYNRDWHTIDRKFYDKIETIYNNPSSQIVEDDILLDIKRRKSDRKQNKISEALKGTWVSETGFEIKFDGNYFYQDVQNIYTFQYNIKRINSDSINVSVYGVEGIFTKGKELSTLDIKMDETKTCMVMKKTMAGGRIYNNKFVYIDEDNTQLGSFDEYFFYKYDR